MKKNVEIQSLSSYNKINYTMDKHIKKETKQKNKGDYIMTKEINFIEEKANAVLEKIHYDGGEVNIIDAAHSLGFIVGISALPSWDDGFILVDDVKENIQNLIGLYTNKAIGVNVKRDLQTRRFIIAHEIGHYELHYNENDGSLYARREDKKGKDAEENDADFFAACLLMPRKYFAAKYEELKNKNLSEDDIIMLLQKNFNTPYESIKRRLREIEQ